MSTFGDIERTFADLYEYRWAISAGVLVFLAAVAGLGYRKGWHLAIWQRRLPVAVVSTPFLVLTIWLGWSLGSPLFTNKTVIEEFPFSHTATVPEGMERIDIEGAMAGMAKAGEAKVDDPVIEPMPGGADIAAAAALAGGEVPGKVTVMTEADKATLLEGLEMVAAGKVDLDSDMMDKGLDMMQAAIESASGPASDQFITEKIKAGSFKDADSFHKGSGQATIYSAPDGTFLLRLEDLEVTNGPALHVYLSRHENPDSPKQVKDPGFVDLGDLKGNRGDQNYLIPREVDVATYNSVVIYCKPFEVVFSVATLRGVE